MNDIYNHATSMVFGWEAMPEGCKVDISAPVFNVISDVMNGNMTGQEWDNGVEKAFAEVSSAK